MKIYNISNCDDLVDTLDQCSGDIRIVTRGDRIFQWREERDTVLSLLQSMDHPRIAEISIEGGDGADVGRLMRFLYAA